MFAQRRPPTPIHTCPHRLLLGLTADSADSSSEVATAPTCACLLSTVCSCSRSFSRSACNHHQQQHKCQHHASKVVGCYHQAVLKLSNLPLLPCWHCHAARDRTAALCCGEQCKPTFVSALCLSAAASFSSASSLPLSAPDRLAARRCLSSSCC